MCMICRNLSIETQWCEACLKKRELFEKKLGRHKQIDKYEVDFSDEAIRQIISALQSK